jgi:membrane protein implicated in regulation of membrane protease activity
MVRFTAALGVTLVVLGIGAYVLTSAVSITALIPAFVGVPLLACAAVARSAARRRPALAVALAIALLGALGSAMNVIKIGEAIAGTAQRPSAVWVSTIMFVLLVIFLAAGGRALLKSRTTTSD